MSCNARFEFITDPIGRKILTKASDFTGRVRVPDGISIIAESAFLMSSATEIFIPDSVKEIEEKAFEQCVSLKRIRLSENLWRLDKFLFVNCLGLESIEIPSSVLEIENGAFFNCTALKQVIVNEGVRKISEDCFVRCTALERVYLPDSVESVSLLSFSGCKSLKEIRAKSVDYTMADELVFVSMGYETLVSVIGARLHCYEDMQSHERNFIDGFFRKSKNVFADFTVLGKKADLALTAFEKGLITQADYIKITERIESNAGL